MAQERNLGIDLLRILSMLMVCLLHVLGVGGVLSSCEPGTASYILLWFLNALSFGAVNLYALISGFVGINASHRFKSIIKLWLQVFFYSVLICFMVSRIRPDLVSTAMIKNAFFPVCTGQYWYFTAYFLLFFVSPLLNAGISAMEEKSLRILLVSGFFILCFLPRSFERDIFLSADGYSFLWLSYLYILGGYIKLYEPLKKVRGGYLVLLFFAFGAISLLPRLFLGERYALYLISYMSPTVVLGSVCLFLAFSKMKIRTFKGIIKFFSAGAFSVYLIHTHPVIFSNFLSGAFFGIGAGGAIISAILIYIACTILDIPRRLLFKIIK